MAERIAEADSDYWLTGRDMLATLGEPGRRLLERLEKREKDR